MKGKKRAMRASFWRENSKHNRANQIKIQDFFNLIFGMKIQISELAIE